MFFAQQQKQFALIAVLALLTAPVVGFAHAAIHHAHTHAADNAFHAVIESGLDGSLSRKDIILPVLYIVLFSLVQLVQFVPTVKKDSTHDKPLLQALRRGVLPHRRFG